MERKELVLELLRTGGGTQPRAELDGATVEAYTEALEAGADFPPVMAFYDGESYWLADGFHRLAAHRRAELVRIDTEVRQGTLRDAVLYSLGANETHGLRRTREDKRRAVTRMLQDPEWRDWSDREIARVCKVGNRFVGDVRRDLCPDTVGGKRTYERDGQRLEMETGAIGGKALEPIGEAETEDLGFYELCACGHPKAVHMGGAGEECGHMFSSGAQCVCCSFKPTGKRWDPPATPASRTVEDEPEGGKEGAPVVEPADTENDVGTRLTIFEAADHVLLAEGSLIGLGISKPWVAECLEHLRQVRQILEGALESARRAEHTAGLMSEEDWRNATKIAAAFDLALLVLDLDEKRILRVDTEARELLVEFCGETKVATAKEWKSLLAYDAIDLKRVNTIYLEGMVACRKRGPDPWAIFAVGQAPPASKGWSFLELEDGTACKYSSEAERDAAWQQLVVECPTRLEG